MSHLRVSPRILGQMLLDTFCERCFFHPVHMDFKLPFDRPMPGIMFNLDNFEKAVVRAHIAEHNELPNWLESLGCEATVEFPAKMTLELPQYDATLVGMPDEVFRKRNGKLCLVDYKSAMCKGDDDPFMPIYKTQLLGYARLLESNKIGTVESAYLIYFENQLKAHSEEPLSLLTKTGFNAPFGVKIHEVELDHSALDPLLKEVRRFADMTLPPEGREKCKDCARLQQLLDAEVLRRNMEEEARARDNYARFVSRQLQQDRTRARQAWQEQDDRSLGSVTEDQDTALSLLDM